MDRRKVLRGREDAEWLTTAPIHRQRHKDVYPGDQIRAMKYCRDTSKVMTAGAKMHALRVITSINGTHLRWSPPQHQG